MLGLGLGFGKLSSYKYTVKKLIDDYIKRVTAAGGYLEGNECATAKVRELNSQRLLDDASWLLIPEGIKEDVVYAQKPTSGLGDLVFTRSSDATRTNSAGVIERTPWNLLTFSEDFSNVAWGKLFASISSNVTTSPIGTLTADKLVEDSTSATHQVFQTVSILASSNYNYSVYLKAAERFRLRVRFTGFSGAQDASVDLNAGTTTSGTLTSVGDGWFRLTWSVSSNTGGVSPLVSIALQDASGNNTYLGNGTSGAFIWGAQLVEGTDAKPYFATTNRQDVPRLDYRNADGTISTCPRLLLEPQRTNSIRNSTMVGAVAGSPGTLPTNWVVNNAGLTQTIAGLGTENGLQYVDFRFSGTASSSEARILFETTTQIAASNGQTWTESVYLKAISGTIPLSQLQIIERTVVGNFVAGGSTTSTPTSTLGRFTFTRTLIGGVTVAFVQPLISFNLTLAATYDFTIRIAAPQMELGAYATTFIPTTTAAVTRLTDAFIRGNLFTNGILTAAGGTWFVDLSNNVALSRDQTSSNSLYIDTTSGGLNNGWAIIANSATGRFRIAKATGTSTVVVYTTLTDNVKIAIKWNGSTADVFVNGSKVVDATSFTSTAIQFLGTGTPDTPRNINQSALFPTPLTDAQCIDITGGRIYYNPVEAYYAYYLTPEIPSAVITSVNSFF
jgi:hypothetical protein